MQGIEIDDGKITVNIALSKKDKTSLTLANLVERANCMHFIPFGLHVLIEQNCQRPAICKTNRAFLLAALKNALYVNIITR